jgi:hypothetical protein
MLHEQPVALAWKKCASATWSGIDSLRKTENDKVNGEFTTVVGREGRVGLELLVEAPKNVALREEMIRPRTHDLDNSESEKEVQSAVRERRSDANSPLWSG